FYFSHVYSALLREQLSQIRGLHRVFEFRFLLSGSLFRCLYAPRPAIQLPDLYGSPGLRHARLLRRPAALGKTRRSCRQRESASPQRFSCRADPHSLLFLASADFPCIYGFRAVFARFDLRTRFPSKNFFSASSVSVRSSARLRIDLGGSFTQRTGDVRLGLKGPGWRTPPSRSLLSDVF